MPSGQFYMEFTGNFTSTQDSVVYLNPLKIGLYTCKDSNCKQCTYSDST